MEFVVFWLVGAVIVGIIAGSRGRTGFGWFVLSLVFSPLLMGILVLALGNPKERKAALADVPTPSTHVRCPDCREFVLKDARKCKHCQAALIPQ